ncbi:MAG: hypothetical protein QM757_24430 [Paludibaculum sp.]
MDRQEIPSRLVYPYSVVPGGVTTPDEVAAAARRDPVVAAHYRGFDFDRAVVTQLYRPRLAYVSYRLDGKIYWTKKKVTVAAGERVITDGRSYIRGRCGNRLIDTPQGEVSTHEPPESVLDTPELPVLALTVLPPGGTAHAEFAPPPESPASGGTSTITPDFYPPDIYPPNVYPAHSDRRRLRHPTGDLLWWRHQPCTTWHGSAPPLQHRSHPRPWSNRRSTRLRSNHLR